MSLDEQVVRLGPADLQGFLLHEQAESVEVGRDHHVALDDPGRSWIVLAGHVDVFVETSGSEVAASRRHVCHVAEGDALLGVRTSAAPGDLRLVAVGSADTVLVGLDRRALLHENPDRAVDERVRRLLEDWVCTLSAAVVQGLVPRDIAAIAAGEAVALEDGRPVRAGGRRLVWTRVAEGAGAFLGEPALPRVAVHGCLPLSEQTWLTASGATLLEGFSTAGCRDRGLLEDALDGFHALVMLALEGAVVRASKERRERRSRSERADLALAQDALGRLDTVLAGPAVVDPDVVASDPLLAACQLVGRRVGIELRRPDRSDGSAHRPLVEISRASRVRMRQVSLTGGWWQRDSGPLLAFVGDEDHPVALLPRGSRAYVLVDPADEVPQPVDETLAVQLDDHAYAFYPPLPDRPLGGRDLLRYSLRGLRTDLVRVLVLGAAGGVLAAAVPVASKQIVDFAIPRDRDDLSLAIALGLVFAAVSSMLFEVVRQLAVLRIQSKLDAGVQAAVWDRLLRLPVPFFRDYGAGDLAVRALGINTISQVVSGATLSALLSGVFSVFSIVVIFTYDQDLGLIAALLAVVIIGVTLLGGVAQLRHQRREAEMVGQVSSLVLQLLSGIAKLRVAGAEVRAFALWARRYALQKSHAAKAQSAANALLIFNSTAGLLSSLVVFLAVALLLGASVTTGEFVAFTTAFGQFLAASAGITIAVTSVLQATPSYERARPILQARPEADVEKPDPGELSGHVELSHVSFRYGPDGPLVLDDVSLHAEPGEFVAIVGPSGAGKSSVFRQLLGFEQASSGTVLYDDQDLAGVNVSSVRRQLGVVMQNGRTMSGSIYQNIAGVAELTVEQAWEAAEMAGLDADIRRMPMGMFTYLGEGATAISGGQRQRMAIARALASRPRIVLFDEATSALDNRTQATVSASLARLKATRIVIAHRLSTIVDADRIYVLEGGRVVQTGTYAELFEREGPFRDLARRQLV